MKCRSPNCRTAAADDSRFCEYHRDLFADIAQEIDDGKESRRRTPERRYRTTFKRCDHPGCPNCAAPREPYCEYHLGILAG
jgi:hypothetical protein